MTHNNHAWGRSAALVLTLFSACLGVSAQNVAGKTLLAPPQPPTSAAQPSTHERIDLSLKAASTVNSSSLGVALAIRAISAGSDGVVRLTLAQAQQAAGAASNPLVRLGELQVEAARQHRLGVQSQYFPALSSSYTSLHFNKHPGQVLTVQGPTGAERQVAVNILNKDENVVNLMAAQPITPLIAIHQLAKIARADENIARAKAGMPVAEAAMAIEKTFFDLLVAQRELTGAEADSKMVKARWMSASNSGKPFVSSTEETEMLGAEKSVLASTSKVMELTASLNQMIGLPDGTKLELIPPDPLVENISLKEVTDKAMAANTEVVEAEQTAIKAHAAATISKLEYGPTVAVIGGYTNQTAINFVFPRAASYLGVMASWTIFDFGKREHGVRESKANADAASLGVQLVKAKVAAAVKSTYFELQRSRQFTQLARRMASSARVVDASYRSDDPEFESAHAKLEADLFRAEFEYRQAYAKLKTLMGTP